MPSSEARCQCGAVRLALPALDPPDAQPKLYNCHCSQCRAQSASAFGASALYPDFALPMDAAPIGVWTRDALPGSRKDCFFCTECGVRLAHRSRPAGEARQEKGGPRYVPKDGRSITIKAGCIEGLDWSRAVHIFCADAVVGLEFPDGAEKYVEDDDSPRWEHRTVQR